MATAEEEQAAEDIDATLGDAEQGSGRGIEEPVSEPVDNGSESNDFEGSYEEPDYGALIDEETRDVSAEQVDPVPAEPQEPQAEAAPPETAEIPAEPVQPEVPQTESAPPAQPEAAPQTPDLGSMSDEEYQKALSDYRSQTLEAMAAHYAMSPEEAARIDDLDTKPSEWLPKLLAQTHLNAHMSVWNAITTAMPQFVQQVTTQQIENQRAEDEFFGRWPDLKGREQVAATAIQAVRQANPQADRKTVIEMAGTLAMMQLGKSPVAAPAAPPAPPVRTPATPVAPAMPGGGAASPPSQRLSYEEEVFADMVSKELQG